MENLKNIYFGIFVLFHSWTSISMQETTTIQCEMRLQPISKIVLSLCSALTKEIGGDENYFFSPLSISVALAMLYIGTQGTTKSQMTYALRYNETGETCLNEKISEEYRNIIISLQNRNDPVSLLVANTLMIQLGYTVSAEYSSNLQEYFKTKIEYLDFANDEVVAMITINQWISNQTNGMINKLLNEPLDSMTVMVIMNVIYFKGLWEHPFPVHVTWNGFFYGKNGSTKIVPFMQQRESFNYYFDDNAKTSYLEMNYITGNMSMLLVLPKRVNDFPQFELTNEWLCSIRSRLQLVTLEVILPKFQLEYKRELSRYMMNLGMNELFSDRADLSGIREQNDLHVSLMVHKAVIEVDEHGSEASAISGVAIDARRSSSEPTFFANHPFLFYIIDKETDIILFVGRVVDP